MKATVKEGQASIGGYAVPIPREVAGRMSGNEVVVGVRPENWRIVSAEEGGLPVKVTVVEELGADGFLYGTSDVGGTPDNIVVRVEARREHQKGETIHVTTDPNHVHVFDSATEARLTA